MTQTEQKNSTANCENNEENAITVASIVERRNIEEFQYTSWLDILILFLLMFSDANIIFIFIYIYCALNIYLYIICAPY